MRPSARLGGLVPSMQRTFNIRLWFAITGFGVIGLICAISAYWLSGFMTRSLLERESEVSQEFLQSIVIVDGTSLFARDAKTAPVNQPLLDFAKHIFSTPGIMRANIYSSDLKVLWSTQESLIGQVFHDNNELETALRGERVTEINSLASHKAEYEAFGVDGLFIEAYLPLREIGPDSPVVGVVELYKFPTALNATIAEGTRIIWLSAIGAALIMYLTLAWIVQRGARLIERQQQQLGSMQAFAVIGELSSAVAHSLRNPMAAIRSSAELWRSDLPPGETQVADDVIHEVDRMDAYVRDLLAYARPDQTQVSLIDPMDSLAAVLMRCEMALRRNGISVNRFDCRSVGSAIAVDPSLFEHALTSIVTNAIEAMPHGGILDLSVADDEASRNVVIQISDNGAGIAPEVLERLTESYITTKVKGLGLGLALARGVIERWHGTLSIVSTRDVGTHVSIAFRRA